MNSKAWVARDKGGSLWLYTEKPHKNVDYWSFCIGNAASLDSDCFPSVKWEDEEPTEVEIIIKPRR